jgi:hypothetical protein
MVLKLDKLINKREKIIKQMCDSKGTMLSENLIKATKQINNLKKKIQEKYGK